VAWKTEGLAATERGDWQVALDNLRPYLHYSPGDLAALKAYISARPHVETPKHTEVNETIGAMQRFLELDPRQKEMRQKLISLYIFIGQDTEARDNAETLLDQTDGKDAGALRVLALANARLKNWDKSMAAYDKLLKIEPYDLRAQMQRIWTMKEWGRPRAEIVKLSDDLLNAPESAVRQCAGPAVPTSQVIRDGSRGARAGSVAARSGGQSGRSPRR
jgi:tetratricopeptide (TPR) repeat protein